MAEPLYKLLGVIDSKQGQSRIAEWLEDELTQLVADETVPRGTYYELVRNEPKDGIASVLFFHPDDYAAVALMRMKR